MATSGILGMFVGATLLTLGYQIFMDGWRTDRRWTSRGGKATISPRKRTVRQSQNEALRTAEPLLVL